MASEAYKAGQKAKSEGKSFEDNPYFGETVRGIRRYTDEAKGSEWAKGLRDEIDRTAKQLPNISSFKRKSNRHYK